tara:strand:- start:88 stop:1035 length:948 start_codon:yes stop_codon:yes gene_type:complete
MKKAEVALVKGESRYENVKESLELIRTNIYDKIRNKNKIIIKPNCVSDSVQLAAVHVDAIRAVLDFISEFSNKKIMIAEGSGYRTQTAFKNFDYLSLKENYNVEFFDLNNDDFEEIEIYDRALKPMKVGIAKTILNADCVISLALLKTHNAAIATFGIKNVAVGSLIKKILFPYRIPVPVVRQIVNRATALRNDKTKVHQGSVAINKNIFELYKKIKPDISIIDGFEAMECNGPIDGSPVQMKLAIAGTDALAVDVVSAELMGINPEDIGYLYYCMQHENFKPEWMKVVGNTTVEECKKNFEMHPSFQSQLRWKV